MEQRLSKLTPSKIRKTTKKSSQQTSSFDSLISNPNSDEIPTISIPINSTLTNIIEYIDLTLVEDEIQDFAKDQIESINDFFYSPDKDIPTTEEKIDFMKNFVMNFLKKK